MIVAGEVVSSTAPRSAGIVINRDLHQIFICRAMVPSRKQLQSNEEISFLTNETNHPWARGKKTDRGGWFAGCPRPPDLGAAPSSREKSPAI